MRLKLIRTDWMCVAILIAFIVGMKVHTRTHMDTHIRKHSLLKTSHTVYTWYLGLILLITHPKIIVILSHLHGKHRQGNT